MRTVEEVVLHSVCWGRRGSVRASSWLLLLYIVTWSSLKAAMPPCLSVPLIRINDVDARCVHFFPEEAALDACAVNKSHPPTPPVSRYSSSTCQLALYQTLPFIFFSLVFATLVPTSSCEPALIFSPPSAMFTAWWNKTAWRWEMCCADEGQTTSVKIVPEILLTTYLGVLYFFILWIIT